jgi:hypothetical protein
MDAARTDGPAAAAAEQQPTLQIEVVSDIM